jgi:hypothetical protein
MTKEQSDFIFLEVTKCFSGCRDPRHNVDHLMRVNNNAIKIVDLLDLKHQIDIHLINSICYLHDITWTKYAQNIYSYLFEGILSVPIVESIINSIPISPIEHIIIIQAIRKHPLSLPFHRLNKRGDIYTKILQDADTLEMFEETRVNMFIKKFPKMLQPLIKKLIYFFQTHLHWFLNYQECSSLQHQLPNMFSLTDSVTSNASPCPG